MDPAKEYQLMASIAGVASKAKVKHSDIGSGVVVAGNFQGEYLEFCENGEIKTHVLSSELLTLPLDIGTKIAKAIKGAGKNRVRFSVHIGMKKSDVLIQGYSWVVTWKVEPEVMGQLDIVKDMLANLVEKED